MKNIMRKIVFALKRFFKFNSVVSKIIGVLLLLSMITMIVGFVGLRKISAMNNVAKDIFDTNVSTISPIDDFLQSLYITYEQASRAVLRGDSSAISALSTTINNTSGQYGNFQYILSEENFKELEKRWNVYERSIRDLYNELSRGGSNVNQYYREFQDQSNNLYSYIHGLRGKLRIAGLESFNKGKLIYRSALLLQTIFTFLGFVIAILVGFWISLSILRPLQQLKSKTELLAGGDLKVQVDIKADEEINAVSQAFNKSVTELRSMVSRSISYSNKMNVSCDELFHVAENAGTTMECISQLVEDLTKGASTQSDTVDNTVQTIQKATDGANSVINATFAINKVCKEASMTTEHGGRAVSEMVSSFDHLVGTVKEINEVIQELENDSKQIMELANVIGEIADQTTLLALNASIEAARAGEGSEGFSVIADNVRHLAAKSEESAKNIRKVVNLIQKKNQNAVESAKAATLGVSDGRKSIIETANLFEDLIKRLDQITISMENIAKIAAQMGESNKDVVSWMETVSNISQNNLAAAEEVSATFQEQFSSMLVVRDAARQLRVLAQELSNAASGFKI